MRHTTPDRTMIDRDQWARRMIEEKWQHAYQAAETKAKVMRMATNEHSTAEPSDLERLNRWFADCKEIYGRVSEILNNGTPSVETASKDAGSQTGKRSRRSD